ncbi:MAG: aminotransferase class IV [Clostridia bacterium]|nr:aminotransferase class IV [Clostridia bacterium]
MENLGYYNGRYDLIERMTIPMNDRAVYFGDGLYEVAYTRNHRIYALTEHMDRMFASAERLKLRMPMGYDELCALLEDLVTKVDDGEQLLYWQVSRGTELRSHAPASPLTANLLITSRPGKLKDIYTPMRLITAEDTRFLHCDMKTLNLLPTVMASIRASEEGADEAVFHRGGRVTECAHSNLAIICSDGTVRTAPADCYILAGVARSHMLAACRRLGIPARQEVFTVEQMMEADEIFVVSSGTLCRPAYEIDGKAVGGKAPRVLKALQDALMAEFMAATDKKM